jgi:hypothetical protein
MPNAVSSGGILVPAPWKWCRMMDEKGEVRLSYAAIETSVVAVRWELQRSAAGSAEFFAKNAGPIQLALGRLDAPKQAALLRDLEQLWIDNNLATKRREPYPDQERVFAGARHEAVGLVRSPRLTR